MYKINIGCSAHKKEGMVNIDIQSNVKPDVVASWNYLPFKEDIFEFANLIHVYEHFLDPLVTMKELWRVCKDKAEIYIVCPYYTSKETYGDPGHIRPISEDSFIFLSQSEYESNRKRKTLMSQYDIDFSFKVKEILIVPHQEWRGREDLKFAIKHYFNVVESIRVSLKAVKILHN